MVIYEDVAEYIEYCNDAHMGEVQVSKYIHVMVVAELPCKG